MLLKRFGHFRCLYDHANHWARLPARGLLLVFCTNRSPTIHRCCKLEHGTDRQSDRQTDRRTDRSVASYSLQSTHDLIDCTEVRSPSPSRQMLSTVIPSTVACWLHSESWGNGVSAFREVLVQYWPAPRRVTVQSWRGGYWSFSGDYGDSCSSSSHMVQLTVMTS